MQKRVPRIVDDTLAANTFSPEIVAALRALRDEITHGTIQPLTENAPDVEFWNLSAREYIGKSWLDVPWFWAETFFFRRILQATRYFQMGNGHLHDPFANLKQRELDAAMTVLPRTLDDLPESDADAFEALLHAALWGNRADLSMFSAHGIAAMRARRENEREFLMVDDTARVWNHLQTRTARVDFICDNAGTELAYDLALVDFLLRANLAERVVMHVKPQPFYVSDAMVHDVEHTLDAFAKSESARVREIAERLARARTLSRLTLMTHPFWVLCKFFFEMPDDLRATLTPAHLIISKGDANYRRLVGDFHWEPTTLFANVTEHMPAPLVAVRTTKAPLIVGLQPNEPARLRSLDPNWLVNGKRGVIQFSAR
jgi:uncharacterized protein with ATP-grasp and redox domains